MLLSAADWFAIPKLSELALSDVCNSYEDLAKVTLIGVGILSLVQWPAMLVTLAAAWLVTSPRPAPRRWGFRLFILSNLLWIVWGVFSQAYALVFLQVGLFLINWHGTENQPRSPSESTE